MDSKTIDLGSVSRQVIHIFKEIHRFTVCAEQSK